MPERDTSSSWHLALVWHMVCVLCAVFALSPSLGSLVRMVRCANAKSKRFPQPYSYTVPLQIQCVSPFHRSSQFLLNCGGVRSHSASLTNSPIIIP